MRFKGEEEEAKGRWTGRAIVFLDIPRTSCMALFRSLNCSSLWAFCRQTGYTIRISYWLAMAVGSGPTWVNFRKLRRTRTGDEARLTSISSYALALLLLCPYNSGCDNTHNPRNLSLQRQRLHVQALSQYLLLSSLEWKKKKRGEIYVARTGNMRCSFIGPSLSQLNFIGQFIRRGHEENRWRTTS